MISGVVVTSLLLAFIGLTTWAWSGRNRARFEAAAQLPLHEDNTPPQACGTAACCCQKEKQQ